MTTRIVRWLSLAAAFAILAAGAGLLRAPAVQAQSGTLSITTDGSVYQPGNTIRLCYTVPRAGPFTITDTQADGTSHVFFSGVDDGTGGCLSGTVTPPFGTECLRIMFTLPGAVRTSQTCFQVGGIPAPPPGPGPCIQIYPPPPGCGATVTTDQSQYMIGDPIRICYTVPGPGPVTITDYPPDGTSKVLLSAVDDGTGGCFGGSVTPPLGTECLQIDASGATGRACFQIGFQG